MHGFPFNDLLNYLSFVVGGGGIVVVIVVVVHPPVVSYYTTNISNLVNVKYIF
jgi:hypothetical protein